MDNPIAAFTQDKKLRRAVIAVLSFLALFLLLETVTVAMRLGHDTTPVTNTITVSGEGKAAAAPDIARITYTVMDTQKSIKDAQANTTKQSNEALTAIKSFGIKDTDIRTVSYNVSPQYSYQNQTCGLGMPCPSGAPTITGYQVMQTVEVKVHDTSKAGDVLQKLGTLGVQNISGPDFTLDNPNSVQDQARAEAIKNARAEATLQAKQLGVHLGKVVSFSEGGNQPYPMYAASGMTDKAMAVGAPAPEIPTGQNEYDTTVSVTYEIW